jgi:hypothetical protein
MLGIIQSKKFICLLIFSLPFLIANAQNEKLTGKVVDAKNLPVVGATVSISSLNKGTSTDVDGRFQLIVGVGKYELTISAVNFATKIISDVEVKNSPNEELQIILDKDIKNLQGVTVRTSSRRETVNALIQFQKNTNAVAQVISAEAIRRSPDKNTGEALKRVTGLSLQEGRYLVVRGLMDRYNQATLNGVLLSSTEPDRKTFSFDIFPASVVENIIVNKTFIPEYSAEWAGGLIQINTRDIPTKNFLNVQVGLNANTNTIGRDFYTYKGGKLDWLGLDDGTRALPAGFPLKNQFASLSDNEKTEVGKQIAAESWGTNAQTGIINTLGQSFQVNGGFNTRLLKKEVGGALAVTYSRTPRNLSYDNRFFTIASDKPNATFDYANNRYSQDVLWGAMANFSIKLNPANKISIKNILNVNSSDYATLRTGRDYDFSISGGNRIKATETALKNNTFFNTQLSGEHNVSSLQSKFNWFGSFTILDQYIPQQRRLQYNQVGNDINDPYEALLSNTLQQKSGSIYYSNLSDYIYNTGADLTTTYNLFSQKQNIKVGYNFQVKDRLFNARPFAIKLPSNNRALLSLDETKIFAPENFGESQNEFHIDQNPGIYFRYLANTILNAGYIQMDNNFTDWLRVVWGVRYENFDQLVGATRKEDPRYSYSNKSDFLPAVNATIKLNNKTNIRVAATQTLVRPEFRELTGTAFYDFEIGATIIGNPSLVRTKITNFDIRYELYPRAGELFTFGAFYKNFKSPIELAFNQTGVGSNTFNYLPNEAITAKTFGAEVEFRKKLDFNPAFSRFTAFGNVSYIYNRVKFENTTLDRSMQGQSPYVLNAGLQYDVEEQGINTTLLFNQVGRRILYVGNDQLPPVWEAPRPLLDLQIAKKVLKGKGEVKLNLSDLLNRRANFYHDLNNDKKFDVTRDALALTRRYGTNIGLSFSYAIK